MSVSRDGHCSNANISMNFEKLRGQCNYMEWRFVMKNALILDNLWCCIDGYTHDDKTTPEVRKRQDQKALSKICLSVDRCCYSHLMKVESAKDAWQALENAYEDKGLNRRLRLLRNLCTIKLEDFSSMETYVNEAISLAQQLASVNKPIDDEFLGAIMLQGLPPEYEPMIMALEHSGTAITSDLIKMKLLQDKRWTRKGDSSNECLYTRNKNVTTKPCVSSRSGVKVNKNESNAKEISERKKLPWCWKCRQKGHMKKDCPSKTNPSVHCVSAYNTNAESNSFWYIDSGATNHMTGQREWMETFSSRNIKVTIASGDVLNCTGIGNVRLSNDVVLTDVLYVPKLSVNLISVSELVRKGSEVRFDVNSCTISNLCNRVLTAKDVGGVYKLDICNLRANLSVSKVTWHQRLGHLSHNNVKLLRDGLADDIHFQNNLDEDEVCEVCLKGKQARFPFITDPEKSLAERRLELVHTDLCGPMPVDSLGGKKYILTFLDDHTRKVFVYFLERKSEVSEHVKDFINLVENQTGDKVKALRSDNGSEYVNRNLNLFLKNKGIVHQVTVPYSPQQNGAAERLNRTLIEKVRCMLYTANLDHKFWAEAASTAAYLINCSPSRRLSGKIPDEAWTGKRVSLKKLRIFGCEAYAHVDKCKRSKLEPKSKRCIFLGYENNGYRLYDLAKGDILRSRDVVFKENVFPGIQKKISVKACTIPIFLSGDDDEIKNYMKNSVVATQTEEPVDTLAGGGANPTSDSHFEAELPIPSELTQVMPQKDGPAYNLRPRVPKTMAVIEQESNEPKSVKEALSFSDAELWRQAMQDEIDSFEQHGAWELIDRPMHKNIVKNRWIFKIKRDADGKIATYRARLVAKGFTQQYGLDYNETFSPVVRHSSIRMLLSLAVELDLKIDHLDVKTAFLNGDLSEEIYMCQPEGFIKKGEEHKVYRLKKAVYGLKQASRSWYEKVKQVLLPLHYVQSKHENCIFVRRVGKKIVIIALYVDDFFIFYNCDKLAKELNQSLNSNFTVKNLGQVKHMLGIKVERTADELKLSQEIYIDQVLERFGMQDCKPVKTPLDANVKFCSTHTNDTFDTKLPYQHLIGSLMYLAVTTRPDISFAVSFLSQFNNCYSTDHWNMAKRVLRYLKGTKDLSLIFKKITNQAKLVGYADADWANGADRKSYTGYIFKLGLNTISWGCYKQSCIALSSTEAEYIALSEAAREAVSCRALLVELTGRTDRVTLYCDNQSAAKLAINPVFHKRTKHVDIRYHYVRDVVSRDIISLHYLCTEDMLADILTKPLHRTRHEVLVKGLIQSAGGQD